jgi:hypothetical protein
VGALDRRMTVAHVGQEPFGLRHELVRLGHDQPVLAAPAKQLDKTLCPNQLRVHLGDVARMPCSPK